MQYSLQSQSMCMNTFIGLNEIWHFSSVASFTSSHIAQTSNFSVSKVHLNSFIILKFNWLIIRWVGGSRTLTSRYIVLLQPLRIQFGRTHSGIKTTVCLHAIGFRLLASSIPRTTVHRLLPTIHRNDVFHITAYFVALFVNACNLKGRLLLEFY